MNTSRRSIQRILREALACKSHKKTIQPKLTNLQKDKRVKFASWVLGNYSKQDTKNWLFTDEKYFDLAIHKTTECRLPLEKKLTEKCFSSES